MVYVQGISVLCFCGSFLVFSVSLFMASTALGLSIADKDSQTNFVDEGLVIANFSIFLINEYSC